MHSIKALYTATATATGGRESVPGTPRDPQTFKLIEPGAPDRAAPAGDGIQRETEFTLLGLHTAAMEVGDTFAYGPATWELTEMFFDNGWERRALVTRRPG